MAVIKDGNGGVQELQVDLISRAARVTLYDTAGNAQTFTLNANVTALAQENGNLKDIEDLESQSQIPLLAALLTEMRINNQLLAIGLNLHNEQFENWRNDPDFLKTDVRHAN